MICPKCGSELEETAQFCGECGKPVVSTNESNAEKQKTNKKTVFILICIFIGLVLFLLLIIFFGGVKFENTNIENPNIIEKSEETTVQKLTALDYLDELKGEYKETKLNEIELPYKYIDGTRLFECSKFENLMIGNIIADFNNDGEDDIFILTLEKMDSDSKNGYADLQIGKKIYLWQSDNSFKKFGEEYSLLQSALSDHVNIQSEFAMVENTDSRYNLVEVRNIDDNSTLYDKNETTYYPIDESLGKHISSIDVHRVANKGFLYSLGVNRIIDHMMGIPKAENCGYEMTVDNGSSVNLYWGGVNTVRTGTNIATPVLESSVSGECQSEEEACDKINEQLTNLNLKELHISPFVWSERYSNSFLLDDLSVETIRLTHSAKEDKDDTGIYKIQIETTEASTRDKATELPTEEDNINYDKYLGTWSNVDNLGQGFTVTISSIVGNDVECYMCKTAPNAAHIAMTEKIFGHLVEDNKVYFDFTDSFMNVGNGVLTLNDDTIHINATVTEFDQPYLYALMGEGELVKISDSTEVPYI